MVEVVQDLLDHVTYAGGMGRRRADSVRGIGVGTLGPSSDDCALLAEDPSDPKGPRIARMQHLMFHEMLDRPFEEKAYHLQLEEFGYRGERIMAQVDQKFGEIQKMIAHDVIVRSKGLPVHLKNVNDELRRAHQLICFELEDVWRITFEPFFYPSDEANADSQNKATTVVGAWGGWLDLDDMFLTGRLLIRYIAELVQLVNRLVNEIPRENIDRSTLKGSKPHPFLYGLVASFSERVPWMCASVIREDAQYALQGRAAGQLGTELSEVRHGKLGFPAAIVSDPCLEGNSKTSILNLAITALDCVLTTHMKQLTSDLHRTMYQTFVRICAAYARWKHAFSRQREAATAGSKRPAVSGRKNSARAGRHNSVSREDQKRGAKPSLSRKTTPVILETPSTPRSKMPTPKGNARANMPSSAATRESGVPSGKDGAGATRKKQTKAADFHQMD